MSHEQRPECRDWLVRLTESESENSKAIGLLTNHWTEINTKQCDMARDMGRLWKVRIGLLLPLVVSLIVKMWV